MHANIHLRRATPVVESVCVGDPLKPDKLFWPPGYDGVREKGKSVRDIKKHKHAHSHTETNKIIYAPHEQPRPDTNSKTKATCSCHVSKHSAKDDAGIPQHSLYKKLPKHELTNLTYSNTITVPVHCNAVTHDSDDAGGLAEIGRPTVLEKHRIGWDRGIGSNFLIGMIVFVVGLVKPASKNRASTPTMRGGSE